MCGICGIVDFENDARHDHEVLERMLRTIRHRGPDDQGILSEGGIALGMRRLSIIDLEGGQQPIFNEGGDVGIVFNGEIYNFLELREELLGRGHRLTTHSDTEVIVHLYEELGIDCLEKLRGMFAFALWDRKERRLLIARDRLGIKPLYYSQVGQTLVFSSEIKAMLQHPSVERRVDLLGLSDYLSLKYVPAPRTMFANVHSLPPGHAMICDQRGLSIRQY